MMIVSQNYTNVLWFLFALTSISPGAVIIGREYPYSNALPAEHVDGPTLPYLFDEVAGWQLYGEIS
ncbi:hypothetical protein ASE00_08665 [Sphingomonas sp. Root710]|nr:hypothetical protein ASE00_08665 [Sphingomonas sp. Root710]